MVVLFKDEEIIQVDQIEETVKTVVKQRQSVLIGINPDENGKIKYI